LCTRTVCALAHVFEAHGIATVALVSVRPVAERMHPPRALYCEFPLGRPLGRPDDPAFQHDVLRRAFALLDRPAGPVLEDHPDVIECDDTALECTLPPRFDPSLHPAVDEAQALRKAYERSRAARGRTSVGRVTDADGIPALVGALVAIADGTDWKRAGLPGDPVSASHDLRTYYEEAALALVDVPPGPGPAEAWFTEQTEAGRILMAARRAMQTAEAPFALWFYMAPGTRA
jgi:hypothetical protein